SGLIICTPSFSWLPLTSLSHIIIERISAGSYRAPKRPYLDYRVALTELARARSLPLTYGDYPLPLEYRPEPAAALSATTGTVSVIDVRSARKEDEAWSAVP